MEQQGINSLEDVNEAIAKHKSINNKAKENKIKKTKSVAEATNNYTKIKKGSFCDYEQRNYDFDALEKKLLGW